jgi:hypothetical protein
MPAFMHYAVRQFDRSDSPAVDWAIYEFCISDLVAQHQTSRFALFETSQAAIVCRFLRFMAECTEGHADAKVAREALQKYWGRFCQGVS